MKDSKSILKDGLTEDMTKLKIAIRLIEDVASVHKDAFYNSRPDKKASLGMGVTLHGAKSRIALVVKAMEDFKEDLEC